MKAPLAIFAYRRPVHLGRCLSALARCARLDECAVTIYCDGPRTDSEKNEVEATRAVAREWARQHSADVRETPENRGLARSIVGGVTELCAANGRVIVLEDDLEPAPDFLAYMLAALDRYETEPQAMQIAGFRPSFAWPWKEDALFLPCTTTWGWATWQRAWARFRWEPDGPAALDDPATAAAFDLGGAHPYAQMLRNRLAGKNDSWGILWWWAVFRAGGLALYPRESLVTVGGFDGSGTHCADDSAPGAEQARGRFPHHEARMPDGATVHAEAFHALRESLRRMTPRPSWWRRAVAPLLAR